MNETPLSWDPFQREVLDALGHVVYVVQGPEVPPLLRALARAANVPVAALPALPAPDQLRSPGAKRALWPRLRAMRKATPR